MAKYDKEGRCEIPDPTPVELPVGYEHPESLEAMIARMIRYESLRAEEAGLESFEEADDFDVSDDVVLVSEHQMTDMQEEYVHDRGERSGKGSRQDHKRSDREERVESETEEKKEKSSRKAVKKVVGQDERESGAVDEQ